MSVRKSNVHDMFITLGATNHSKLTREINDFYATEPKDVEKLLEKEKFDSNIWDCCCGKGHISEVLKNHNYNVYSTDLIDRGYCDDTMDFLKCIDNVNCDIITNPPYSLALEIIQKALDITSNGNKIAMLLKIQFLESAKRKKFFDLFPPKYVYVFSERINCAKNGEFEKYKSSAICYAWYIWIKGEYNEPIIRWI